MSSYRSLFRFVLLASALLITLVWPTRSLAQEVGPRTVRLTLLPDFETGQVTVDGSVSPANLSAQAAALIDWGLGQALQAEKTSDTGWHVRGRLPGATVTAVEEGSSYRLNLPALTLAPGDSLTLLLPFANLSTAEISPPPDNLARLTSDFRPLLPTLRYSAAENGRELQLEIPFTPLQKEIDLQIMPLIGELLGGKSDSLRLSGQVTFSNLIDFTEFERHCENSPNSPFFRYRTADLLFALDHPPAFHFGFLSPVYQFKPTYTLVRSNLLNCQYQDQGGQVQAQFSGRIFQVSPHQSRFPDLLQSTDVTESHQPYTGFGAAPGEYQFTLGQIVLAPDDLLRVTLPQAVIHSVSPAPTRFDLDESGQTLIEYHGPRQFALTIRYSPESQMLLRQTPATIRSFFTRFETGLSPFFDRFATPGQLGWSWGLLLAGAGLSLFAFRLSGRLRSGVGYLGWLLLSVALLYGLRGVFGWLLLAVAWYFFGRGDQSRLRLLKGGLAIILVLLAMGLDARAEALFAVLSTIELDLTPLTPLILLALGLALAGLLAWRPEKSLDAFSWPELRPLILFLFTSSIYDVLQESLPALLLIAAGAAWLLNSQPDAAPKESPPNEPNLQERFELMRGSWLVPAGVLVFTVFAMQHNLQQTSAVFGPSVGLWAALLAPLLLFVSILLTVSIIALLYTLLYPLLPFQAGHLKAIVLALFLLLVFLLGVGSDDRLIQGLDGLLVGRFIYYLSVPLLIGLYFDIKQYQAEAGPAPEADDDTELDQALSFYKAASQYLKELKGLTGASTSLLSLAAPSLYAYLFDQPVVATYFDLLVQLINLSAGGL